MNNIKNQITWPDEGAIDLTGVNGEVQEPSYRIDDTLYRINPAGEYALVWNSKKWMENGRFTNSFVKSVGEVEL